MQLVHTRMRLGAPLTRALTACKFTFQRRLVTLCACEMLLPNCGPLPQMSHICAIALLQILCRSNCRNRSGVYRLTHPTRPCARAAVGGEDRQTAPRLAESPVYPEPCSPAKPRAIPPGPRVGAFHSAGK